MYNTAMKYTFSFLLIRLSGWLFGILMPICLVIYATLQQEMPVCLLPIALLPSLCIAILLFLSRHACYSPHYIDRMDGTQFEQYLHYWYARHGYYHIRLTQKSRDYGADLTMRKGLHKIVVQAKRYDRPIGVHAVQQALAAKAYYKADYAIVATNNYFTPSAKKLAEVNDVILMDRETLFGIARKK